VTLTEYQVQFYSDNGYLAIDSIVSLDEVAWLREIYDRLFTERAGRASGDQFDLGGTDEEGKEAVLPQILGPSQYAPELLNGDYRKEALAIAKQLLGAEAEPAGEHAIFKPARTGAETPWHQDEAYWDPSLEYNSISIWIPLQEATVENGCMWFVPGSHKGEIVPHQSIGNDPRIHGLEIAGPIEGNTVVCPLSAGGCTIHNNRTLHYAGPNTSSIPRRAYILAFGVPTKKREMSLDFPWQREKHTARMERAKGKPT